MREVIVVSRSKKNARKRVSRVLDAYFWRIGDQTWRGKATNACLDRVSRELRKSASRHMAVSIQEIRSSSESRTPLIRIGSSRAFSDDGKSPVASSPSIKSKTDLPAQLASGRSIVQLAVLFHDVGKATKLFQGKLHRSIKSRKGEADAIRHELFSAYIWDDLFGDMDDLSLLERLPKLTASEVDISAKRVVTKIMQAHSVVMRATSKDDKKGLAHSFSHSNGDGSITQAVGLLILSHHRLPGGSTNLKNLTGEVHIRGDLPLSRSDLEIAPGQPFWHEKWFQVQISKIASALEKDACKKVGSIDISLRASLMLGDHMGSARKVQQDKAPDHMANTLDGSCADSLSMHTQRVCNAATRAYNMLNTQQHGFPSLLESQVPLGIRQPSNTNERFFWQANAVEKAKELASSNEGGFFACLLAGTGTGKTRGAPAILAAASLYDADPARRYLRFTLGLGLRVLTKQSADEYVNDLGFSDKDVSVVVGQKPIDFENKLFDDEVFYDGSESQINLPEWLRVEMATGDVPLDGDEGEEEWLRSLSIDTSRRLPAFCDRVLMHAGKKQSSGRRLLEPPVMICTIDNIMSIASPNRS